MSSWSRSARVVALLLITLVVLVGPVAGPSLATAAEAPAPVLAQPAGDGGFGDDGAITDQYGNSIWDYQVSGKYPRGVGDVGQAMRNLPLGLAATVFGLIQIAVAAIAVMLRFALRFGIAELLLAPVTELVGVYQAFVSQLGLVPLALMLCVFWFGLAALRGRIGKGVGEIALSFVLVVVLGAVLAAPGPMLLSEQGLLGRAKDVGSTVAMLAVQEPAVALRVAECEQLSRGDARPDGCDLDDFGDRAPNVDQPEVLAAMVEVWLVDMFVRQPHQHIVYGQRIDCPVAVNVRRWSHPTGDPDDQPCEPSSCVKRYNAIVSASLTEARSMIDAGEANRSADPYSYMYDMMHPDDGGYEFDDGCEDAEALALAEYSEGGSWARIGIVVFTLLALLVLFVFVAVGVVFPLAIAQIMIAILIVALVFVLPVALLGGGARQILWKWAGLMFGALFMVIVALFGLSLMLLTTDLLLQSTWHLSMSMLLVSFSSIVFLVIQRRLLKGGTAGGTHLGRAFGTIGQRARGGGAPAGAGAGRDDVAWERPVDRAMDRSTGFVTLRGHRQNLAQQRAMAREQKNLNAVKNAHPEISRQETYRMMEAQDMYRDNHPDVQRWVAHRKRLDAWPGKAGNRGRTSGREREREPTWSDDLDTDYHGQVRDPVWNRVKSRIRGRRDQATAAARPWPSDLPAGAADDTGDDGMDGDGSHGWRDRWHQRINEWAYQRADKVIEGGQWNTRFRPEDDDR